MGVNISEYADYAIVYDYEQDDSIAPNFSANNKNILCVSDDDKITISCDGKKYSFSINTNDIFAEFDRIIKWEFSK